MGEEGGGNSTYVFSPSCFSDDSVELPRNALRKIYTDVQVDKDDRKLDVTPYFSPRTPNTLPSVFSSGSMEQIY